jgi:hypothetical protein
MTALPALRFPPSRSSGYHAYEALREITWTMSFDRAGKGLANERKFPFIVEVPVATKGLKVELSRQIVDFHKSRGITPQLGRTTFRDRKSYYRWCFSDLEAARAFVEQFGGTSYKTTGK